MRKSIAVAIATSALFMSPAWASEAFIDTAAIGCKSEADYKQYLSLITDHDKVAANKFLNPLFAVGACRVFGPDDTITITDHAFFSGLVSIRPKGEVESFWTSMERVKIR